VFVTHDHDEAFALGDRLIVMHDGQVVQDGTPAEVWQHPTSAFVARFLGWNVTSAFGDTPRALRPEDLELLPESSPTAGAGGVVSTRTFRRDHHLVSIALDRQTKATQTDELSEEIRPEEIRVAVPVDQAPPDIGERVVVRAAHDAGIAITS